MGDNLWCVAALYLNEKTDEANARLLKRATDYIASNPEAQKRIGAKEYANTPGKLPNTSRTPPEKPGLPKPLS